MKYYKYWLSKYLDFHKKNSSRFISSVKSCLNIGGAKEMLAVTSIVETSFGTLMQISESNYVKNLMKS